MVVNSSHIKGEYVVYTVFRAIGVKEAELGLGKEE